MLVVCFHTEVPASGTAMMLICAGILQGPMVTTMTPVSVSDSSQTVTLTFDSGLTANTDYLLKLIAKDNFGNCQGQFTNLLVHTLDNVPPVTLAMDVANITGTSAALQLTLNEPGTVFYMVLDSTTGAAACPTADEVGIGCIAQVPVQQRHVPLKFGWHAYA